MGYLFVDLETSGLAPCFDVPLQAAFVECDADLGVQRELTLRCRLPAHVVPSPDALAITGISPATLDEQRHSHLDMMAQIHRIITDAKPTMILGYNNLKFDDEMLRQSFYQTLLPPYAGSMTGHGRGDVLVMLRAVIMLEPDAIVVPRDDAGNSVLKLGMVCRANGIGLAEEDAHDALADVRATRDLFRLLLERAPATMSNMLSHAKKSGPIALMELGEPLLLGGTSLLTPVVPTIGSPNNPNARVCVNLSIEPADYINLAATDLLARIRSRGSPIRQVKTNAMPMLFAWDQASHALVAPEPDHVYRERARAIWAHPTFLARLALALKDQYADREASPYPDQQLYSGGFVSDADVVACRRFHEIDWKLRERFAASHIRAPRLRSLALRQIFLNAPEALSAEARVRGEAWLRHRLTTTEDVPWMTIPKALERCDELVASGDAKTTEAVQQVRAWLVERRNARGPASAVEASLAAAS